MIAVGQVDQHKTGMHEIELGFRQRIRCNIVSPDFEVAMREKFEKARVEIGRHDPAFEANSVTEPARDAATASTDFEASPPVCNANIGDMANRPGIEDRCKS
jgi:hypothetical protein